MDILCFSDSDDSDYAGDPITKRTVSGFTVCSRCIFVLTIKGTEKCDSVVFTDWLGSAFRDSKRGNVCDLVAVNHEYFSLAYHHGKSQQCRSTIYCKKCHNC